MSDIKRKIKQVPKQIQESKYIVLFLLIAFAAAVWILTSCKIEDDDLFWHLSTGRYIIETGSVPDKDVFGYSTVNAEWIPFEWGFDVLSYGLYSAGGMAALNLLRLVIFTLFFIIYYLLLKKFKVNSFTAVFFMLVLLFALMDRLSPRPHIFSYLFFALLMYLLYSFKYFERDKYSKWLYAVPPIFLIWGNLHPGVIADGLYVFIFIISELIYFYYPKKYYRGTPPPLTPVLMKKLIYTGIVSALVLLINPHGISTYIYAYNHSNMKMLDSIQEWLSPFSGLAEPTFVLTLYKVLLFALLIVIIYSVKKHDLTFFMTGVIFAVYSLRAIRFGVDYEIFAVILIAVSSNYYINNFISKNKTAFNFFNSSIPKISLAALLIIISYSALNNSLYEFLKYYKQTGWGISENYTPVKLFDFIKENNIKGTPLNNFETGGYQMWVQPGEKLFIDSRNLNDKVFEDYLTLLYTKPGFDVLLNSYGIDYFIYFDPKMVKNTAALTKNLAGYFSVQKNWKLVYWDDRSMLYLKQAPHFEIIIAKYEYRVFNPFSALFNRREFEQNIKNNPEIAEQEIQRKRGSEPQGYFFLNMNDIAQSVLKK